MGKILAGLARLLFPLLILAGVGYNTWQVNALRAEVAALKRGRASSSPAERGEMGALLGEARRHAEQARLFLRRKQYNEAQRAMRSAAATLERALAQDGSPVERASATVRSGAASALATLRRAIDTLSDETGTLWQRQESEKKKP